MKITHIFGALVLASIAVTPALGKCRVAEAADAGGRVGFERDRSAAIENEQRESASSSVIGKCVNGITSVIVVPTFPSLGDIFAQAANRVCRVANDKIRQASSLPSLAVGGLPTTTLPLPAILGPSIPTPPAPEESFWSHIWR